MITQKLSSAGIIVNISPYKCGTTSIYQALAKSSYICSSRLKESKFFSDETNESFKNIPHAMRYIGNYYMGVDWHNQLYGSRDCKYRIDFSPSYSVSKNTPELIKRHYDTVKLIFIVRNPIERFVSHYYEYIKQGMKLPTLDAVIQDDSLPVSRFLYSFCSYRKIFERYKEQFGEENICIIDFSDLKKDHKKVECRLKKFLSIDDFVYNPTENEMNKSGVPRFLFLQRLILNDWVIRLGRHLPSRLKVPVHALRRVLQRANTITRKYEELREANKVLLGDKLRDDIAFYMEVKTGLYDDFNK